jgi:DNA/RNA-binding domain of Phe-tRNA-synthetase-like protein
MSDELDLRSAEGFVQPDVKAEFPGLRLTWVTAEARVARSPPELARRLQALSNRYRGSGVVAMRTQPIPHAYRSFFRQIGLDPDVTRVPSEQAAVGRLLRGGFVSRDVLHDALLLAVLETGVPVWAIDADRVDAGGLGIRMTTAGDSFGPDSADPAELPSGRLVVADAARIHALLFGEVTAAHRPGPATTRLALFTIGVDGVPSIHLEEALWVSLEALKPRRTP